MIKRGQTKVTTNLCDSKPESARFLYFRKGQNTHYIIGTQYVCYGLLFTFFVIKKGNFDSNKILQLWRNLTTLPNSYAVEARRDILQVTAAVAPRIINLVVSLNVNQAQRISGDFLLMHCIYTILCIMLDYYCKHRKIRK